uniref:NADH dehydrogenase subunit 6 n=1 Tax=Leptochiton nexus TaxID=2719131 RepID=A0A6H1PG37_9MOLL|nr:NADH dehydrogenase subunit 6 [Leptochiton nexus]QIZ12596.1 NADH dehydrogenase subunit 6 [Leptochiton nexus]
MTLAFLFAYILSFCFIIPVLSHPINLGLSILLMALLISMTSIFQVSSWFGFILVLIYIGGLLVMFAYVAALTPNILLSNIKMLLSYTSLFLLFLLMFFYSKIFAMGMNPHMTERFPWETNYSKTGLVISSNFNLSILISMISILLFALICVVKICYFNQGALRPFKK